MGPSTGTLEYQMVRVGACKEVSQRPDDPYVFFQQVGQAARCAGRLIERLQAFGSREPKEFNHGSPGG